MANHKSAKKRSIQSISRNIVNSRYSTKIRTSLNNFKEAIKSKKDQQIQTAFSEVNSIMAKAVKKGVITKHFASRKLSLLSNQIK
ncbi:MAG: 30S ribosomal protein S20 [Pelagibacteraceae bacterium]|nr:30S ribosomal protein S20 [Pelagibacteraceae bacterium]|tara:strand:+ start:25260 stop:25514 length:255 start_codon:yes stop_codon:yes gene_type:complete